jgi:hypothetical protein
MEWRSDMKSGERRKTVFIVLLGGLLILLIASIAAVMVIMRNMRAPAANLDVAQTRLSANGLFQASYRPEVEPIPINELQTWTLHVETPDGQPVENAIIMVDGGMPEHAHGLPTQPQVTQYLGNGDYRVEGIRFQMPGWWEMKFTIAAGGQTDQVVFNLQLGR